jgi:hypothetical protein
MKKGLPLLIALTLVLSSFQKPNATDDGKKFIGVWTLVQCVVKSGDVITGYPFSKNPVGQLQYDQNGNMMVIVTNPEIKKFQSSNSDQGTPEEMMAAFKGSVAYYGTYTVVADSGFVLHHVKASEFPNWNGTDQRRYYEFKDDQLTLKTPVSGNLHYELTWRRNK